MAAARSSPDNPFFNYTREQCLAAVVQIQKRIELNAQQIAHAGSGSVIHAAAENDSKNLKWLRQRLAEIDGLPDPTEPRLKRWRFR